MLKIFMISFAILSVILTGCVSKEPEPQVAEEKLDLEHVKRIEEQEREQEEKAAELLAQEAALNLEEEEEEEEEEKEKEKEGNDESQTTGTDLLFGKNLTTTDANTEKVQSDDSQKDSQETKLTATIKEIFSKGAEVLSQKTTNKQEEIETLEIIEPDSSVKKSLDTLEKTSDKKTKVTIIENTKKDKIKPKFLPNSEPAFSSALKLISCKEVPERMAAIHKRLLETKDINIADRKLRDSNNDTLMPVIHFDFDQIKIKKDYRKLLRQQSPCVMKSLEARGDMILQIEGHADERGSDEYNMALGHRRANAVSNSIIPYLSDSKLSRIFSYGEEFPLIDGSNKKAWGKNRRVEFTLLLKP